MHDLNRTYSDLLNGENRTVLTKVATHVFANVVATAIKDGLVEDSSAPKEDELPTDLLQTRDLFTTRFEMTAGLQTTSVHYKSLGHAFQRNRHSLGRSPDRLFRSRSQMVPALYDLVREHRNLIMHENDSGTPPRVISLCGAILGILELSTPDVDSQSLRQQCESAVLLVGKGMTAQHEQDRRETGSDTSETSRPEAPRTGELEAEIGRLRAEVGRLKEQRARPELELNAQARNRRLEEIDSTVREIARRLDQVVSETQSAVAESHSVAKEVDRKIGLLTETVAHAQLGVVDDGDGEAGDFPFCETDSEDVPKLTVSMAREQLLQLRNRIYGNGSVQPWENICMMSPIVDTALDVASEHGLSTIDEWLALDVVQERYSRHSEVMDPQIEAFGEEMMGVYRQVERWSA